RVHPLGVLQRGVGIAQVEIRGPGALQIFDQLAGIAGEEGRAQVDGSGHVAALAIADAAGMDGSRGWTRSVTTRQEPSLPSEDPARNLPSARGTDKADCRERHPDQRERRVSNS